MKHAQCTRKIMSNSVNVQWASVHKTGGRNSGVNRPFWFIWSKLLIEIFIVFCCHSLVYITVFSLSLYCIDFWFPGSCTSRPAGFQTRWCTGVSVTLLSAYCPQKAKYLMWPTSDNMNYFKLPSITNVTVVFHECCHLTGQQEEREKQISIDGNRGWEKMGRLCGACKFISQFVVRFYLPLPPFHRILWFKEIRWYKPQWLGEITDGGASVV